MDTPRPHNAIRVPPLLRALTGWVRLPILKGPMRGRRWLLHAHGKLTRVLLNSYEPHQTVLFQRLLSEGDTVFDVGAHVGYYTLLSAVLVGPGGKVAAFEPDPENVRDLAAHVRINRLENVTVVAGAVGRESGSARLELGPGSGRGRLSKEGTVEVRTVSLDDFVVETGLRPRLVKIDVEGAEMPVLRGARTLLETVRPALVLSTHGKGRRERCVEYLTPLGYRFEQIGGNDFELFCDPGD